MVFLLYILSKISKFHGKRHLIDCPLAKRCIYEYVDLRGTTVILLAASTKFSGELQRDKSNNFNFVPSKPEHT